MQVTNWGDALAAPVEVWIVDPHVDRITRKMVYGKHDLPKAPSLWSYRIKDSPHIFSVKPGRKKLDHTNAIYAFENFNTRHEAEAYLLRRAAARVKVAEKELKAEQLKHDRLVKKIGRQGA